MISAEGRFVIAYIGEIYNYRAFTAELAATGRSVVGGSTSELLEACALWGGERALAKWVGTYAFALWDRQTRRLTFARNPLGIKPMFWARFGELLLSDSKLNAPAPIRNAWRDHLFGAANRQHALWTVLMFQSWRAYWGQAA